MKKYYFIMILISFLCFVKADSIDNQLINELQESKENAESKKKNVAKDSKKSQDSKQDSTSNSKQDSTSKQDSKLDSKESTKELATQDKNSKKSNKKIKKVSKPEIEEVIIESTEITTTDSKDSNKQDNEQNQKDLEKQIEILEAKLDSKRKEKPLKWFIGAYLATRYNATFNGASAQNFDLGMQGGIYYYVAKNHGARGFATITYSSLANNQVFLIGVGADYFYSFQSGFRIFGGASANLPLNNAVLNKNDVIIYGGIGGFLAKSHYIELRLGYPIMQDSRLSNSAIIQIGYQYIFDK